MIEWIIRRSVANRFLVMMGALFLSIWGTWTIINTPVDALPDLSDVQVIIKTSYPGQAPQIVENQVTYPLTTTMLSVPGAKTVRGFSQFGDSYVYVIFEDGTDLYWARSRVLEYLNQVQGKLPAGVSSEIGPDATGVGWIFEYALVDRNGKHDLSELRSLQDWFLKFELKTIPNVAEVASVGGVVKQYQIQVNPVKLSQYGISLPEVKQALESSNQEAGGSSVEMAEAEYMVRASGYLQSIDDFNNIVLKTGENGVPVYLRDVARVQTGPEMRRGIAELNGQGEVAGGVVILRSGKHDVDLAAELNELRELFEPLADETGKTITVEGEGVVAGDSDMLRRAFSNLLSNAIKYSPDNTCTAIHLERDSDCVNVMITNTMSGQVPANLERLFDRFYRADSSRFYNTEGAGLGLSITRSIIHAHGGELSAEQQGREIVFSVRLLMD